MNHPLTEVAPRRLELDGVHRLSEALVGERVIEELATWAAGGLPISPGPRSRSPALVEQCQRSKGPARHGRR
eukprot:2213410-Prorocentrum_lima.AAC.1